MTEPAPAVDPVDTCQAGSAAEPRRVAPATWSTPRLTRLRAGATEVGLDPSIEGLDGFKPCS
jgi:hypothetical protein